MDQWIPFCGVIERRWLYYGWNSLSDFRPGLVRYFVHNVSASCFSGRRLVLVGPEKDRMVLWRSAMYASLPSNVLGFKLESPDCESDALTTCPPRWSYIPVSLVPISPVSPVSPVYRYAGI